LCSRTFVYLRRSLVFMPHPLRGPKDSALRGGNQDVVIQYLHELRAHQAGMESRLERRLLTLTEQVNQLLKREAEGTGTWKALTQWGNAPHRGSAFAHNRHTRRNVSKKRHTRGQGVEAPPRQELVPMKQQDEAAACSPSTDCKEPVAASPSDASSNTRLREKYNHLHTMFVEAGGPPESWAGRITSHPRFHNFISGMVCFNSLLLGFQINNDAVSESRNVASEVAEYICVAIFSFELFFRLYGLRWRFFAKGERWWGIFDIVLVAISWIEVGSLVLIGAGGALPGPGASMGKMLKLARMVRIARMIRMIRFLVKLRIMAVMIFGSMCSLFWLFLLVFLVMYIFAVVLTQGATDYFKPDGPTTPPLFGGDFDDVRERFGSVPRSIYTLFLAMTGGVSWGEPASYSQNAGTLYFLVFVVFVFFTFFSVLNIVTGVFVDDAIQHANSDRQMVADKALKAKEDLGNQLLELLHEVDADGSGCITKDEFFNALETDAIVSMLASLEVEIHDVENLWVEMDINGDNIVSIEEFVAGMRKLKEHARSIDVHIVYARVNKLLDTLAQIADALSPAARASSRCNSCADQSLRARVQLAPP